MIGFSEFCQELREDTPFEKLGFLIFDQLRALEAADKATAGPQDKVVHPASAMKKGEKALPDQSLKRRRVSFRE